MPNRSLDGQQIDQSVQQELLQLAKQSSKGLTQQQLNELLQQLAQPNYQDWQYQQSLITFTYQLTHHLSRTQLQSYLTTSGGRFTETAYLAQASLTLSEGESYPLYFLKSQTDQELALHELVIGLYVANQLRQVAPNFACVYGWLESGYSPGSGLTLLYEWIPGPTLDLYCRTCTKEQFIKAYLQILLALEVAQTVQFCHYDLHNQNVIMRPISPTIISYSLGTGLVKLKLDSLATLIDYDVAYAKVTVDQKVYQLALDRDLTRYGIYSTKPRPLYDAFKLLGFLAFGVVRHQRWELWSVVKYCLAFFVRVEDDSDLIKWLTEQRSQYFNPQPITASLADYLAYLQLNPELWLVES